MRRSVPSELATPLPLEARNAIAELLVHALSEGAGDAVVSAVRRALTEAPSGATPAPVAAVLREAGFDAGCEWQPRAVARLGAYERVLVRAPKGTTLGARLAQAHALLGAGLYFETHEILEPAWLESSDDVKRWLQGLIQAAVAWHHYDAGNSKGAASLSISARDKLVDAPADWHGFPARAIGEAAAAWAEWLGQGGAGDPPGRGIGVDLT